MNGFAELAGSLILILALIITVGTIMLTGMAIAMLYEHYHRKRTISERLREVAKAAQNERR